MAKLSKTQIDVLHQLAKIGGRANWLSTPLIGRPYWFIDLGTKFSDRTFRSLMKKGLISKMINGDRIFAYITDKGRAALAEIRANEYPVAADATLDILIHTHIEGEQP